MSSFLKQLSSFDAYPKLNEEFKVKTSSGALISLFSISMILLLFFSELSLYLQVDTVDHLFVDVSRGEKLKINFDVTFPHIPCSLLSLDAMDVSGAHQLDVSHHINKKALDRFGSIVGDEVKHELGNTLNDAQKKEYAAGANKNGTEASGMLEPIDGQPTAVIPAPKIDPTKVPGYCGPCYGAELAPNQCCNTCDSVRDVYRARGWALASLNTIEQCLSSGQTQDSMVAELARGDGCNMYGYLEVNKVAGNFHFAPGKSFQHAHMHIHDLAAFPAERFNVSHRINSLSFGDSYPGIINPLDSIEKTLAPDEGSGMFMYYIKVVPTTYTALDAKPLHTNQFSVTEHFRALSAREGAGLPGCFFFYELSPIMVAFEETKKSLPHFATQLCAILGGVFTVAGMVDRLVYSSMRGMKKKIGEGKNY